MKSVLNTVDCNASVINISDDVICISDDMIVISSDSDMSGSECGSVIIVGEVTDNTPSFDFESSTKMLLPQPRTSTPMVQHNAVDTVVKVKKLDGYSNSRVDSESTTISFDFDTVAPPSLALSVVQRRPAPLQPLHPPHSPHPINFPSYDSTSSASLFHFEAGPEDDILCEPFISTPDPTISLPVFRSDSLPSLHVSAYCPITSNISDWNALDQNSNDIPSALSLLPFIPAQPTNSNKAGTDMKSLLQQHFPADGNDFCFCLPSFESAFMSNDTFEYFTSLQRPQQPQCEFVMYMELAPCDNTDSTIVYEQL